MPETCKNPVDLKIARSKHRQALKQIDNEAYQNHIYSLNNPKALAAMVKKRDNGTICLIKNQNNEELDLQGFANALVNEHFDISKGTKTPNRKGNVMATSPLLSLNSFSLSLQMNLSRNQLWCSGTIKPLVWTILHQMYSSSPENFIDHIVRIMKASLALGYTSDTWRRSKVTFLPNPAETHSYRPITLTPFLFKALERLVLWELGSKYITYHENQHDFRIGRKCHVTQPYHKQLFTGCAKKRALGFDSFYLRY